MPGYVLAFRAVNEGPPDPEQVAAWGAWFQQIGGSVVDFGHRVGRRKALGASARDDGKGLSGYVVVQAADLDAAVALAEGCPGLRYGGGVDIGEVVDG